MRIIFMGSPDFAVPTLDALVEAGHDVVAVYTQPPRPAGRGKAERPTAVDDRAGELGIEVRCPKSLRSEIEQEAFAELDADVAVVAAYGLILPQPILDAPMFGCLNVHGSLLPRWRGAAPVQRAIMAGDEVTGVTIMQMEAGLDTGPMLLKRAVEIEDKNAAQLTEELAKLGAAMMVEVLADLPSFEPIPQPEDGVTYAAKIKKEEARIDWARPARGSRPPGPGPCSLPRRLVRGRTASGSSCWLSRARDGHGAPGQVLDDSLTIACGDGALRPTLAATRRQGSDERRTNCCAASRFPKGTSLAMTRWRLTIEFDGGPFMGWQRQDHGPSVQETVEQALFRMTGELATLHAAGRTDAGVHALAMTAHVDVVKTSDRASIARGAERAGPAGADQRDRSAAGRRRLARALFAASAGATSTASSTDGRRLPWTRARCGMCRWRSTPRRWRREHGIWSVTTTSPPSDRSIASRPAR